MLSISTFAYGMDKLENKIEKPLEKILWLGYKTTHRKYDSQKCCTILEIAAIVTDKWLEPIAESNSLVINAKDWILEDVEEPLKEEYKKSGLLEKVRASKLTISEAETILLAFINTHFPDPEYRPITYMKDPLYARATIVTEEMEKLGKRIRKQIGFGLGQWAQAWDEAGFYTQSNQPTAIEEARDLLRELQHYKKRYFDSVKEAK